MTDDSVFVPLTVVGIGDGEDWTPVAGHVRRVNFRIVEQFYEIDETDGAKAVVQLFDPVRQLYVEEDADTIAGLISEARS